MSSDAKDLLLDNDGNPLVVFHGTPLDHDEFDLDRHHTVGIHFGCQIQARARLEKCDSGWIIAAHLINGRVLEVRNLRGTLVDPFCESPSLTAVHLRARNILNDEDMASLGFEGLSMLTANGLVWDQDSRRAKNRELLQRLKCHADIIKYGNLNEPKDGKVRDAFCVLTNGQVVRLKKEQFQKISPHDHSDE